MTKQLTAIYRTSKGASLIHLESNDFNTKKAFTESLKTKGFTVAAVLTKEQIVDYFQSPSNSSDSLLTYIQQNLVLPEGAVIHEVKMVGIGNIYKMPNNEIVFTSYYGGLFLNKENGTAEAYDINKFNLQLTRGEIVEADSFTEMFIGEPSLAVHKALGFQVAVMGRVTQRTDAGNVESSALIASLKADGTPTDKIYQASYDILAFIF